MVRRDESGGLHERNDAALHGLGASSIGQSSPTYTQPR